jgi:hypothetical protein
MSADLIAFPNYHSPTVPAPGPVHRSKAANCRERIVRAISELARAGDERRLYLLSRIADDFVETLQEKGVYR